MYANSTLAPMMIPGIATGRERERVEEPAAARHRALREPRHREPQRTDDRRGGDPEQAAVDERVAERRVGEHEAVVLE
jgi:hypothetical protein